MSAETHRSSRKGAGRRVWRKRSLVVALTAAVLLASSAALVRMLEARTSREAQMDGLHLRVQQARWLVDHMDHGAQFERPASMMPGMPLRGIERFTIEFLLYNPGNEPRVFREEELSLYAENGDVFQPNYVQWPKLELQPGQRIHTLAFFDVAERDDALQLRWTRGDETHNLLFTYTPGHHSEQEQLEQDRPDEWPPTVAWLPPGDAERGKRIYNEAYSCASCHGLPGAAGSETVGPNLANIGSVAADRVAGESAAQYLYTSILDPAAVVAPRMRRRAALRRAQPHAPLRQAGHGQRPVRSGGVLEEPVTACAGSGAGFSGTTGRPRAAPGQRLLCRVRPG